ELGHKVSRQGAYHAYVGSGEYPVRLRVLGPGDSRGIEPGGTGAVRIHLPLPLPLLPGDRFVLRESGRAETVGGGEVLDVAPVLPASRARPSRSVERVVAERGWVGADELELLTGERRAPTVGRWVVSPEELLATEARVRKAVAGAGAIGLDLALLDEHERALLPSLDDVAVDGGRARPRSTSAD